MGSFHPEGITLLILREYGLEAGLTLCMPFLRVKVLPVARGDHEDFLKRYVSVMLSRPHFSHLYVLPSQKRTDKYILGHTN